MVLRRASSRPPALGRTRAPHLPCLFTRHHLCPALPRASFLSLAPVVDVLQLSLPRSLVSPTAPGPAHRPYSQDSQTTNPSFRPPPLAVREERSPWGWAWVCAIAKPSNLTPVPHLIHKPISSPASGGDTTPSPAVKGEHIDCKSSQARVHFLFLPGLYLDPPQTEKPWAGLDSLTDKYLGFQREAPLGRRILS